MDVFDILQSDGLNTLPGVEMLVEGEGVGLRTQQKRSLHKFDAYIHIVCSEVFGLQFSDLIESQLLTHLHTSKSDRLLNFVHEA